MARIAGVDLPRDKRLEICLTYIYGIGRYQSNQILKETNIDPNIRVKDLTEEQVALLKDQIENHHVVEGDLRREIQLNIKRLGEIGCYRGIRHRKNLPVRCQNTRNNAKTRRSSFKRKKVGGNK